MSLTRLAFLAAAIAVSGAANASPVTFTGTAQIASVSAANGYLPTYLGGTPAVGDIVSFTLTYDPATLGPQQLIQPPDTVLYPGGITSFSMTLNGVTLANPDTQQPGESSVIVTTSSTPVLGIPSFVDGYSITAGINNDPNGNHWGANFFFFDGNIGSLAAPQSLPSPTQFTLAGLGYRSFDVNGVFDGFGAVLLSIQQVPEPSLAGLLGAGLVALAARRRSR